MPNSNPRDYFVTKRESSVKVFPQEAHQKRGCLPLRDLLPDLSDHCRRERERDAHMTQLSLGRLAPSPLPRLCVRCRHTSGYRKFFFSSIQEFS